MLRKLNYKLLLCLIFVFTGVTFFFSYEAFSVPAYDGLFLLQQPSGYTFKARKRGDEWHNWVETEEGYGIYKNRKTNCWEYYLPSDDPDKPRLGIRCTEDDGVIVGNIDPASRNIPKRLRPAKIKKMESSIEKTEVYRQKTPQKVFERTSKSKKISGTIKLLVIGVQFEDHPATYSADDIQPLLFGESSSIADYFNDVSYGAVTIEPASESHGTSNDGFIGWLQLSGNHPNTGSDKDHATDKQTAENAMVAASDYIDFASYDADGDGYIVATELAVLIIVAGYEAAAGSDEPSVWGHASGTSVTTDDINLGSFAMVGEKHGSHMGTMGVMVHELGHLIFDLPDLYDTDKDNGDSLGIGDFGLMGSGCWGVKSGEYAGSSPTHPCAWSKEYLSWGTVNTINSSQTISLSKADGNSSSMFRLDTSDTDQYFLIENRQFSGYDIGFGSSWHGGIVIYHIDTSKADMRYDVNADEDDKGVDVEEANEGSVGYSMLDTYERPVHTNMFYFSGNNDSFSDLTTPNSRLKNGNSTNISITDISSYGDTMSAYVILLPEATTGSITNLDSGSATLNGTVNPYGEETTVWFEYGIISGTYSNTTSAQNISGSGEIAISSDINGLSEGITYYYRIVAQNSIGTAYGNEKSFISITTTPTVSTTNSHTMALKSDGTVWAWGYNGSGQLGDGSTTDRYTPVEVSGLSGVMDIAAGDSHSLALKSDGTVWAWGYNGSGQLGDGSTTDRYTPVEVSGLSGVMDIAAGDSHSLALKSDGTVWAWGHNRYGRLGDGTTTQRTTPIQVSDLSGVVAIAVGSRHSLALKSDGTVWAWGYNGSGQLGDGSTTDRYTPVEVSGLSGVMDIAAGDSHSLALKSDGTVWAWGQNEYGQLGDGTTTQRTTPIQASDLSGVVVIAAGSGHSLAMQLDGTVWAWGINVYGERGNGTSFIQNTPLQVNINLGETPDTFAPTGSIKINTDSDYVDSASVTLTFSASDNIGVTGYFLSSSSAKPSIDNVGWTSISSTINYGEDISYTLSGGDESKTLYVWYKDAAGNVSDSASDSITLDTTAPTVSIISHTFDAMYSTTGIIISLSGSASDSASGVKSVTWSNTATGSNGTAIGTTNWSVSDISLSDGSNSITVTATDNAGNVATDTFAATSTEANVSITPKTIDLNSKKKFKTIVKLPSVYDIEDVVCGTIECEGAMAVDCTAKKNKLKIIFKIQDLDIDLENDKTKKMDFTVSGELENGTMFVGSDNVKVKQ